MARQKYKTLFARDDDQMDLRFAASIGRLRVLEDSFLEKEELVRLSDPNMPYTARKSMLEQAGYSASSDFEEAIRISRDEQDALLKEFSADSGLDEFLLLDLDYHNLKAIVRFLLLQRRYWEEYADTARVDGDESESLAKLGSIPLGLQPMLRKSAQTDVEALYSVILEMMQGKIVENNGSFRPAFFGHIMQVIATAAKGSDLSAPDLLADRLYFEELYSYTKNPQHKSLHRFERDYVRLLADQANLEIYLRVKRSQGAKSLLVSALVPHGSIEEADYIRAYNGEVAIEDLFKQSPISEYFDSFPKYETKAEIRSFGTTKDQLLEALMIKGKKQSFGPEAIVAFWIGKRMERRNLRLILQSIGRGLKQEEILPMLRPIYKEIEE